MFSYKTFITLVILEASGCATAANPREVAGCYQVNLTPNVLEIKYEQNISRFSVPIKIELTNRPNTDFIDGSGFMTARSLDNSVTDDKGFFWEWNGKILSLRIGSDYSGISAQLFENGDEFSGLATPYMDVGPVEFTEGQMTINKTPCAMEEIR